MFESLLARLAVALDAAGLPYMVFGGQAVLLHGDPRLTHDIDVTLGADPSLLAAVLVVVRDLGLVPLVEPETFVRDTYVLPCEERESGIRVALVFSNEGYERAAIARAVVAFVGGADVRFASVEELLVQMVAGRPRDVEDARGVLTRHPASDVAYVRQWLAAFDAALGLATEAAFDRLVVESARQA